MRSNSQWRARRSQITIFVIAAIVLLISVALLYYLRASTMEVKPPVENLEVNDKVKPIQTYVIECLEMTSKEALIKLGQNGGYIETSNMRISPIPYASDAVLFAPQVLPYWYHIRDCKESSIGCLDSLKPPLCDEKDPCIMNSKGPNSIEEQLSRYVDENLERCVDFGTFENQFIIKAQEPKTTTIIRKGVVEFQLDYKIEVQDRASSDKTTIPYFTSTHNVALDDIYDLASAITQAQADTNFLETNTMNLVSIYSGLDANKLPPYSKVMLTTDIVTWTRNDVKETMMNDVLPFMSFIRIIGTNNDGQLMSSDMTDYSLYADGVYRSMEYNINNKSYDLRADFIYPYSDIYLDFGGSQILKPDEFTPDMPLMKAMGIFIKEYKFKYDISYPMIVRLQDEHAFNGEGYSFDYALEVNVRNNVPVKGNISVVNLGGSGEIRLDSQIQKVNRTITIKAYDAYTSKPLENVTIYYNCGAQYLVGTTRMHAKEALLADRYPFCELGGRIVYERTGYMGSAIEYDNHEGNDPVTFEVRLWPVVQKKVIVMKRTPANVESIRKGGPALFSLQAANITSNETVFISISRYKDSPYETDIPQIGFLTVTRSGKTDITFDEKKQILDMYAQHTITLEQRDEMLAELGDTEQSPQIVESLDTLEVVPGKYEVDAFMIHAGNIHIPKESRKMCVIEVMGICLSSKTINLPEQNFSSWINGGAKLNFTLSKNDVYGAKDTIVIYVLEQPLPMNWKMMENYQSLEDYQKGKNNLLRPRLE